MLLLLFYLFIYFLLQNETVKHTNTQMLPEDSQHAVALRLNGVKFGNYMQSVSDNTLINCDKSSKIT